MLFTRKQFRLNTDCVEFCPIRPNEDLLVVGCYELNPATQQRKGKLEFLRFQPSPLDAGNHVLETVSEIDLAGVLDMEWRSRADSTGKAILASATADGSIHLSKVNHLFLRIKPRTLKASLEGAAVVTAFSVCQSLLLSVSWFSEHEVIVSSSDGQLAAVTISNAEPIIDRIWNGHDLEIWTTATDLHNVKNKNVLKLHFFRETLFILEEMIIASKDGTFEQNPQFRLCFFQIVVLIPQEFAPSQ